MSHAFFMARGDVPTDASFVEGAWACTGCGACRSRCDHKNDVAGTLFDTRAALRAAGVLPESLANSPAATRARKSLEQTSSPSTRNQGAARVALLVGCKHQPAEHADATEVAYAIFGRADVEVVDVCCGRPLEAAGQRAEYLEHRRRLHTRLESFDELLVADASCAETLVRAAAPGTRPSLLISRALLALDTAPPGALARAFSGPVRIHDTCALGRQLGNYGDPRAILTRVLGRAPDEFSYHHERSRCSGAGGLLDETFPEVAQEIARARVTEHQALGGGTIVTSCAGSLAAFRAQGADAIDLMTLLRRSLEAARDA
jgi:Fe-S oxidoreductase